MLSLKNITKTYAAGEQKVAALKGIDLHFRKSEFVSVLGPSGCGKTTLLNLIGGLDQYDGGDLVINGRSTKSYTDRDWDTYRNHSIGFVFQSYNLIPHQTVRTNVELALTLSGVSKAERRRRAEDALKKVGLGDQMNKKPNQMSGGQMQRVAIARALVNDPDILLADEPTGALDSETSVQVMELLKEIAKDRLIIMVTHNPELAQTYSTRIIRLLDGKIIDDSNPCSEDEARAQIVPEVPAADKKTVQKKQKKSSMSFLTAMSLSLNNLMTKKTRTLLTSFAGSIGIIGIALILSVSSGVQLYIDSVQEDTLSSYPIQIQAETMDMTAMMLGMMETANAHQHENDAIYSNPVLSQMANAMNNALGTKNDLTSLREYLNDPATKIHEIASAVQYVYDVDLNIYVRDENGKAQQADVDELMSVAMGNASSYAADFGTQLWQELLPGRDGEPVHDLLKEQYDVIHGRWPQAYNEIMVVVNSRNEVSDLGLFALGLKSMEEMKAITEATLRGEQIPIDVSRWTYEEMCNHTVRLVLSSSYWQPNQLTGTYMDLSQTETGRDYLYDNGVELKVVGIIRPSENASSTMLSGSVVYTTALTEYIMNETAKSDPVLAQKKDIAIDIFSGLPFLTDNDRNLTNAQKAQRLKDWMPGRTVAQKAEMYVDYAATPSAEWLNSTMNQQLASMDRAQLEKQMIDAAVQATGMSPEKLQAYFAQMDDATFMGYVRSEMAKRLTEQYAAGVRQQLAAVPAAQLAAMLDAQIANADEAKLADLYDSYEDRMYSTSTLEENLEILGCVDKEHPSAINLYASTFEAKDQISAKIDAYNAGRDEDDKIVYTDYVALLMSSFTTILNAISYVLISFVAISLVVSSIMIGIITYISVLERTKEIGILRAIGASKKDIARVFNAEAIIVGFAAGAIGIGVTLLLNMLINVILHALTEIPNLNAVLPVGGGFILVAISMFLTFIAGLIPSRIAAKKDPVVALRTE